MKEIAPFSVVTSNNNEDTNPVTNEDAALAVDRLENTLFAATVVMQEYSGLSREHRCVCSLIGDLEEPLKTIKAFCASQGFTVLSEASAPSTTL